MKNTLIKWLGGVTQAELDAATGDAFINAVRTDNRQSVDARCLRYFRALNKIADCETPSANGTVRRMARIAREAVRRG